MRREHASEPYIQVCRGEEFADSFATRFFAKTFPTLFPVGNGGPRQAEESITDMSSRNMSLETWAQLVLQRHGGRFAIHHIFAFLVFNMLVRSRNRRVSMLSVTRKNFPEVERVVRSLSAERLERAKEELEVSGKTTDEGVNKLLRSLSLYGLRQPMSKECRLSMRRNIKSLIIRYGIPAIWFTLNPNDIMNPIKLRLAAYRSREPEEAEAFLTSLDLMYKRARLAISDPISSVIFFHREISIFFKHYVRTGEESVFGRINQYFGAVETNERGALHLHGLLWLHGNMHLTSALSDVSGDDQTAYRERIIQYVDSVFTEVCLPYSPDRWMELANVRLMIAGSRPRSIFSSSCGEVSDVGHIINTTKQSTICGCIQRGSQFLRRLHSNSHSQSNLCQILHGGPGKEARSLPIQGSLEISGEDCVYGRWSAADST